MMGMSGGRIGMILALLAMSPATPATAPRSTSALTLMSTSAEKLIGRRPRSQEPLVHERQALEGDLARRGVEGRALPLLDVDAPKLPVDHLGAVSVEEGDDGVAVLVGQVAARVEQLTELLGQPAAQLPRVLGRHGPGEGDLPP